MVFTTLFLEINEMESAEQTFHNHESQNEEKRKRGCKNKIAHGFISNFINDLKIIMRFDNKKFDIHGINHKEEETPWH